MADDHGAAILDRIRPAGVLRRPILAGRRCDRIRCAGLPVDGCGSVPRRIVATCAPNYRRHLAGRATAGESPPSRSPGVARRVVSTREHRNRADPRHRPKSRAPRLPATYHSIAPPISGTSTSTCKPSATTCSELARNRSTLPPGSGFPPTRNHDFPKTRETLRGPERLVTTALNPHRLARGSVGRQLISRTHAHADVRASRAARLRGRHVSELIDRNLIHAVA